MFDGARKIHCMHNLNFLLYKCPDRLYLVLGYLVTALHVVLCVCRPPVSYKWYGIEEEHTCVRECRLHSKGLLELRVYVLFHIW